MRDRLAEVETAGQRCKRTEAQEAQEEDKMAK